jgi:hypothetical protein
MFRPRVTVCCLLAAGLFVRDSAGENTDVRGAQPPFVHTVRPFLMTYCAGCHGGDEPEGGLSFERYEDSARVQTDFEVWEKVRRMLTERNMPPANTPQPAEAELQAAVSAIERELSAFDCTGGPHPGRVTLHRLNQAEYNNTIRDLVGIDCQPAGDFPSDDVGEGFDNIGDVLTLPPLLMERYLAAAEQIVDQALADERARSRILGQSGPAEESDDKRAAFVRNIRAFAGRAYRRPVTEDELERLMDIAKFAHAEGAEHEEILKTVLQAVLTSPHFLFRVEQDPPADDEDGIRALDDYELASRLSYFLWSSMPDDELFRLAAAGTLHEPAVLREQALRMLGDPKSRALIDNFVGQWLQLRDLARVNPDPELFPQFDDDLRRAMRRETELLFERVMREDRSVLELLAAEYTFVNERLARHYGIAGVTGDAFQQVDLPEGRRGLLTHAGILLLTSNPTRTSPVKRGKWILDNILDEPPPPPPAGVEELAEATEVLGSLRERLEEHRSNESCAVCHRRMDPLGFGLENFDAIGAWREMDGRFEIDASGTLPGDVSFSGPDELVQILVEQNGGKFVRCLTKKLLTYALGRGLTSQDRCAVDRIERELAESDYRFRTLIGAIVTSAPFMLREAQKED